MVKFYVSWDGGRGKYVMGTLVIQRDLLGVTPVLAHTAGLQLNKLKHTLGTQACTQNARTQQ